MSCAPWDASVLCFLSPGHLDRLRKNDSISVSVKTGMLLQQKLLFVRLSGVPPTGPTIWLDFHPLDFAKFCALGMGNVQPSEEQFSLPEACNIFGPTSIWVIGLGFRVYRVILSGLYKDNGNYYLGFRVGVPWSWETTSSCFYLVTTSTTVVFIRCSYRYRY